MGTHLFEPSYFISHIIKALLTSKHNDLRRIYITGSDEHCKICILLLTPNCIHQLIFILHIFVQMLKHLDGKSSLELDLWNAMAI